MKKREKTEEQLVTGHSDNVSSGRGMPQHLLDRESTSLTCGCELQLSTQLDLGLGDEDVEGSSKRFTREFARGSVAIGAAWRAMFSIFIILLQAPHSEDLSNRLREEISILSGSFEQFPVANLSLEMSSWSCLLHSDSNMSILCTSWPWPRWDARDDSPTGS